MGHPPGGWNWGQVDGYLAPDVGGGGWGELLGNGNKIRIAKIYFSWWRFLIQEDIRILELYEGFWFGEGSFQMDPDGVMEEWPKESICHATRGKAWLQIKKDVVALNMGERVWRILKRDRTNTGPRCLTIFYFRRGGDGLRNFAIFSFSDWSFEIPDWIWKLTPFNGCKLSHRFMDDKGREG